MSTPLALATVTAVLQNFIQNSITDHDLAATLGGSITVSAEPPDRIDNGASSPDRINLFLFQATENQGWRNVALPSRNADGDRINNPPLALDLSYLLTAYGSGPLHAEALLGLAMFVLHEMPVLTRDAIRAVAVAPPQPPLLAGLQASELADQIEQIKVVPQVMSVEEISKIWSALQSQYRPTAVYKATVVLVESQILSGQPAGARTQPEGHSLRASGNRFAPIPGKQRGADRAGSADSRRLQSRH